jgi:hypothetical protein
MSEPADPYQKMTEAYATRDRIRAEIDASGDLGGTDVDGPFPPPPVSALPLESGARKDVPMARGLLDYFPAALAEVAKVSQYGNEKHNPGEELHHARGKSTDHADCVIRHLVDRGTRDADGQRHTALVAWRALALLQQELEDEGLAPLPRGARL